MPQIDSTTTINGTLTTTQTTTVNTGGSSKTGLIVQAAGSQTADLIECRDVYGDVMSAFKSDGSILTNGVLTNTFGNLSVPTGLTATGASGGSFSAGTYYWVLTAFNSTGQTMPSTQATAIVAAGQKVTLSWTAVPGASGYYLYRTTTSGTYGATSFVAIISAGTTTSYVDTGAATTTGTPPASTFGSKVVLQAWKGQGANILECQDYTGSATVHVTGAGVLSGDGSGLSLNGSNVTSGTVPLARGGTGTAGTNLPHCWAYFVVSGGVVTLGQSFGVSSVTRGSTGSYTVNFSTTTSSNGYCVMAMCDNLSGSGNLTAATGTRTTSAVALTITLGSGTLTDPSGCNVVIFGV